MHEHRRRTTTALSLLTVVFLRIVAVSTIGRISTFSVLQAPGVVVQLGRRARRCLPYDANDYRYAQSVEDRIVAELGGVYVPCPCRSRPPKITGLMRACVAFAPNATHRRHRPVAGSTVRVLRGPGSVASSMSRGPVTEPVGCRRANVVPGQCVRADARSFRPRRGPVTASHFP